MAFSAKPFIAVALTAPQVGLLLEDVALAGAADRAGLAFLTFGGERIVPGFPAGAVTFDPSVAAGFLSTSISRTGLVVAAVPQRDHPYNLARRVSSIDHIGRGRVGVLLGQRDYSAPYQQDGRAAWGGAGLGNGVPLKPETVADAALALQELWQSWPLDSIIADRESRVYVESDRIKNVKHRGAFDIVGPLTVPSSVQGTPVLGVHAAEPEQLAPIEEYTELVVLAPSAEPGFVQEAIRRLHSPSARRRAVVVQRVVRGVDEAVTSLRSLAEEASSYGADGVLVGTDASDKDGLTRFFLHHLPQAVGDVFAPAAGGTLRSVLGLADPPDRLSGATSAFPVAS